MMVTFHPCLAFVLFSPELACHLALCLAPYKCSASPGVGQVFLIVSLPPTYSSSAMAAAAIESVGVSVPAPDLNGAQVADPAIYFQRYNDEKNKRLRAQGTGQFVNLRTSPKYSRFLEDPWIASGTPVNQAVADGSHVKALVIGAGYGALQSAVHLIKAGIAAKEILIVDPAGGFGGTW